MAFTANDYLVDAADLYGDEDMNRVVEATWIRFLNSAIRALILVRPDAGSVTESVQLAAGVKQDMPSDALRILDITRNMGTDGLTTGKVITPTNRKHVDYSNLLWSQETGEAAIDNFAYDKNAPAVFYVTPPASSSVDVYVEMILSKLPTAVTATGDSTGTNDVFFEPIVQYMLYKAFVADDESQEFGKAISYLQTFFNLLQVEMTASMAQGPEVKE